MRERIDAPICLLYAAVWAVLARSSQPTASTAHSLHTSDCRMHRCDKVKAAGRATRSPHHRITAGASVHDARRPAQGRGLATRAPWASYQQSAIVGSWTPRCVPYSRRSSSSLPTNSGRARSSHPSSRRRHPLFNLPLFESTLLFLPLLIAHPHLNRSLQHTKHTPSNFRPSPPSAQLSIPPPPHAPSP